MKMSDVDPPEHTIYPVESGIRNVRREKRKRNQRKMVVDGAGIKLIVQIKQKKGKKK